MCMKVCAWHFPIHQHGVFGVYDWNFHASIGLHMCLVQ